MKKTILPILMIVFALSQTMAQVSYIEYKISSAGSGVSGSSKVYSLVGNVRSELTINSPQMPAGMHRTILILRDSAGKAYMLDEKNKTYTVTDISGVKAKEENPKLYDVTVVGKEKVNGYNATHIKVKRVDATQEEDLWVSTDVGNYKKYMSVKNQYSTEGLYKAMAAKGVDGFPVRISVAEHGMQMQLDLVKAEPRDNPLSLFSLDGYKSAGTNGAGAGSEDMMKKIQNMTPEERKQFIDQMRQQQMQQAQPH